MPDRLGRSGVWATYVCAHGHRFRIDTRTEPEQYVVKCPVCGTITVRDDGRRVLDV